MNEKEIIKRCQNGDRAAFDTLIRAYYPYVTKYLLKLTHDEILTEDLTQEVFLKMIRSIDKYKSGGKAAFATYLITAAKNTFIDYTRRAKAAADDITELDIQSEDNIEYSVISSMQYEEIVKYIDSLPPNQASVIRLKYIDELTLREIEQITGIPSKTVKSRIHEGVKKLRSLLKSNERTDFFG